MGLLPTCKLRTSLPAASLHDMVAYGPRFCGTHIALCALFLLEVCLAECVTATPREDNDKATTLFMGRRTWRRLP
jgi:hypothetical protein